MRGVGWCGLGGVVFFAGAVACGSACAIAGCGGKILAEPIGAGVDGGDAPSVPIGKTADGGPGRDDAASPDPGPSPSPSPGPPSPPNPKPPVPGPPSPDPQAGTCVYAPVDTTGLASCCGGAAHCAKLSGRAGRAAFDTCPDGKACVPDALLSTGGATPTACTSIAGAGVCLSTCMPGVAGYASFLTVDVCATGERCVPCVSPLDGSPTGACDIGTGGACK